MHVRYQTTGRHVPTITGIPCLDPMNCVREELSFDERSCRWTGEVGGLGSRSVIFRAEVFAGKRPYNSPDFAGSAPVPERFNPGPTARDRSGRRLWAGCRRTKRTHAEHCGRRPPNACGVKGENDWLLPVATAAPTLRSRVDVPT
jgi:hypothetical protein